MNAFSNAFVKKWFWIFTVLFVVVMLPLPFFYVERYIPSLWGLPLFIVGWTVHTLVTMLMIFVFYAQAMKRPEYHEFDEK